MSHLAASATATATASVAAARRSEFPDWVLVGRLAHIGRRRDDVATAVAETSDGHRIEVSFVPSDPPALTRCFVHCPDLTAGDFVDEPPFIIAADGAFLLISVFFSRRRFDSIDYFVFRSGPGTPSLDLLPRPYPVAALSIHVGVLSCGGQYLVVDPEWRFHGDGRMSYYLHIFSSKTKSWCSKAARLPCGMKGYRGWFEPNKVLAIGGGSMAWVDLRNGILLCDSVAKEEHPEVRLIQLPPLMPINDGPGLDFDGDLMPSLDSIRDVTCSNGWFRSIEVGFPHAKQLNFQWTATMFKMMISSKECQWEPYGTTNSVDISPADSCLPDLLPEIWYPKYNKLTLSNVVSLYPTLDVCNDNMVYMVAKLKSTDPSGWVLSVNTANKKLEKISPFLEESFHFWRIFLQCDFSKHLSKAPGEILLICFPSTMQNHVNSFCLGKTLKQARLQ